MRVDEVEIILAPFHAGSAGVRVGRGPARLMREGLAERLAALGVSVEVSDIEPVDAFEGEIGRSFEVKRRVSQAVSKAVSGGRFPVVLAGNCNTTVGVAAGLGRADAGVIWFDAHPDFDTPDEARSGYFDGMGLATLTGQCWRALAATIPGFQPMSVERLVYCGVRDFEPGQAEKVERFGVRTVCGGGAGPRDFAHALEAELERVPFREMIIHIDLDCLDTSVGQANEYSSPGGLSADDLSACLDRACRRLQPLALTVASFNPDLEGGDAIARAGVEAIETVVRRAGRG